MNCMIDNQCMSNYPKDGYCVGSDEADLDTSLTDLDEVRGDWWVIRGLNCGRDESFPGGYDWFPCIHARFQELDDGRWINWSTFCAGKDNQCLSHGGGAGIRTVANVTLPRPGLIRQEYDTALAPQVRTESFFNVKLL